MKNKQEQQQEMQQNRNVIHTELCNKVKEKKREKEHTDLRDSPLIKATSTGGKTESFLLQMQYTSGSLYSEKIQGILTLYKQRTKQKK